jgi:hypothetical protein
MRRGLWLFLLTLGHPGIAAEFAMADDANRSMAAPAIDGNRSSAESIYFAGAAGSWRRIASGGPRRPPGQARHGHPARGGSSGPIRVWRAPCCDAESKAPNGRESACARGDTGAGILLPGDATSLVTGPRRAARELEIKVADGSAPIDGVVALLGLREALQSLNAERAQK